MTHVRVEPTGEMSSYPQYKLMVVTDTTWNLEGENGHMVLKDGRGEGYNFLIDYSGNR